jgi:hypothetical protein
MTENEQDRMKKLLQQALLPVKEQQSRDLWPRMLRRIEANIAMQDAPAGVRNWIQCWTWLDGSLAFGILGLIAVFPAAIPVLLYNL